MTLHVLRGISGSGKTTFALTSPQFNSAVRISRDDLRRELFGITGKAVLDNAKETRVTKEQEARVRNLLIAGKNVVIDDTNIRESYVVKWLNMATDYGHDYLVHPLKVSLETAIARNDRRSAEEQVPIEVIEKQFSKYNREAKIRPSASHPFVSWSPLNRQVGDSIIVDIDGTLAINNSGLSPYDPNHYPTDQVNRPLKSLVSTLVLTYRVLIVSGREQSHEGVTRRWLLENGIRYDELYMRKAGDGRRDDVVKSQILNYIVSIDGYAPFAVFDDRDRCVKMWRTRGLLTLQVANGDF